MHIWHCVCVALLTNCCQIQAGQSILLSDWWLFSASAGSSPSLAAVLLALHCFSGILIMHAKSE
jgi:hypothetical protein